MSAPPRSPSAVKTPHLLVDFAVTLGVMAVGSVGGGLYFSLVLGATHSFTRWVSGLLFPAALILGILAWRVVVIPISLLLLARDAAKHGRVTEELDTKLEQLPGRGVLLVVPPLVCVAVGFVLGLFSRELSLMGTTLHMAVLGSLWGLALFILTGLGYLRIGMDDL